MNMKIAAILALSDFPMWEQTVRHLCLLCDELYVRFDGVAGDPEIYRALPKVAGNKLRHIHVAQQPWHPPEWREDGLRMLDDTKPDIVVALDQDELFGDGISEEIERFAASDKDAMMFGYEPLVTRDRRTVNGGAPYPPEPHMKVFRWKPGLSYYPWHRHGGVVAKYVNKACHWNATTKISHYCAYTEGLEAGKQWRSDIPGARADRAVTLLGFGPSSHQPNLPVAGEIWSLNNCYEVFAPSSMKYCTRIFEMHKMEKRGLDQMKDGRTHAWHLDQLGRMGHRIIMQHPHPNIAMSEAYPIEEVVSSFGLKYFTGTPAYMVAMAIKEHYSEIRVYGFDQMDWEHILQRESFVWWLGFAAGRGMAVSGKLTFLERGRRLYGYEYGPEFDEQCQRDLWRGFPFEIKFKEPTRAMAGDMYDGVR